MAAQQNNNEDVLDEDTLIPEYIELTDDEMSFLEWIGNKEGRHGEYDETQLSAYVAAIIEKLVEHIEKQNNTIANLVCK